MRDLSEKIYAYMEMIVGTGLTAAAFVFFVIPMNFACAGVTGFAEVMTRVIPIALSWMVLLINGLFLLLGLIFIGREFTAKTLVVSILFPFFLDLFSRIPVSGSMGPIPGAVAAGMILGLGSGMTVRSGASTGGFGTLAVIMNRKLAISIALAMNVCDAVVILISGQSIVGTIYGVMVITVAAAVAGQVVKLNVKAVTGRIPAGIRS